MENTCPRCQSDDLGATEYGETLDCFCLSCGLQWIPTTPALTGVVSEDGTRARFETDGPSTWLHIEYPSPNGTYSSEPALSLVLDTAQFDRYLATLGYKRS